MEWRSLPEILDAEQLIELALHRAAKKRSGQSDSAARKLSSLADNLGAPLGAIVEKFPSLDQLHPFDHDIVNLSVGLDELRQSLGGIDWARKQLQKLGGQFSSKAARARGERALQLQRQGYGRLTSVVRQVSDRLEFLRNARKILGPKQTVVTTFSLFGSISRAARPNQPSVPNLSGSQVCHMSIERK